MAVGLPGQLPRFIAVAVPGLMAYVAGIAWMLIGAVDRNGPLFVLGVSAVIAGPLAMLWGTALWRKWLYLFPIYAIPMVFFACCVIVALISNAASFTPVLVGGGIAILVLTLITRSIHRHYRTRDKNGTEQAQR